MRYCRIKGKLCVFATEYGYCSFTVCREVTELRAAYQKYAA